MVVEKYQKVAEDIFSYFNKVPRGIKRYYFSYFGTSHIYFDTNWYLFLCVGLNLMDHPLLF